MKTLVLHSGGLDSTCLLLRMLKYHPGNVGTVSVNYGQRHIRELEAASEIRVHLDINKHFELDLSSVGHLLKGSSQTDPNVEVPEGHYEAESMKLTVVPNRNMLMLAAAASVGIANGYDAIAFAAHAGDHAIYPDCRPSFLIAMQSALDEATGWVDLKDRVILLAPFISMTKHELLKDTAVVQEISFPWEMTWSCYKGIGDTHCGKCGTCVERKEAFKYAKIEDKTIYADA